MTVVAEVRNWWPLVVGAGLALALGIGFLIADVRERRSGVMR